MNSVRTVTYYFNRLLPFTIPGTPLYQDLVHALALCAILYYAPNYFENRRRRQVQAEDVGNVGPDIPTEVLPDPESPLEPEHEAAEDDLDVSEDENEEVPPVAPFPPGAEVEDDPNDDADQPGPANPQRRASAQTRNVGAKKAKSIARRDQRRAYHEFMRSQGDAQRAQDAADAEEREAELFEEKRRRAVAEAALEEKARKEREERREKERKAREDEVRTREQAIGMVRKAVNEVGAADLGRIASKVGRDRDWLERLVRADGMVGAGFRQDRTGKAGSITMITSGGWVVRLDEAAMGEVWSAAMKEESMEITYADMATKLEAVVRGRIAA